jgi:hypothetical protein
MKQLNSWFRSEELMFSGSRGRLLSAFGLCSTLVVACGQQIANAEQLPSVSSEPVSNVLEAPAAQGLAVEDVERGDAELRRGYGVVDMRANACVTQKNDHTFVGTACPSGIVIYGPYVAVPENADIEVAFDIKANKRIEVYADIVSRMGAQTLAGLNHQSIEGGASRTLGYRVHMFNAETNVESRIGMKAEPGTEFEIANLTMTVR